mmetsp:Transcript_18553/g.44758  ORF Transcript_18553/g.44758 Transcript_18553/m.44758 type:complete len:292 (-) Transcript_18553:151-1026(-)
MSAQAVSDQTRQEFAGKSVLLTGASGGLGTQLATQLAICGVKAIVLSGRSMDALKKVESECQKQLQEDSATKFYSVPCDLSDKVSVEKLGTEALKLCGGTIDCLVNCGGVSSRSNFVDTRPDVDEKVMQINFLSGALLSKMVVPSMISQQSGRIIWISSVQGLMGIPSRTSYAASKFAVQGYCESLRAEMASSGITVHCVSPGYIRTNLSKSAITGDGTAHGKMDATTAAGADPQDVAVEVLDSCVKGKNDFVVAATTSAKVAIWLRFFCPGVLQNLLVKRFEKSEKAKQE